MPTSPALGDLIAMPLLLTKDPEILAIVYNIFCQVHDVLEGNLAAHLEMHGIKVSKLKQLRGPKGAACL